LADARMRVCVRACSAVLECAAHACIPKGSAARTCK
jgi:hypothetical protein